MMVTRTHLKIRQGSVELDAPIHETIGTIDDTLLVQSTECLNNSFRESLV